MDKSDILARHLSRQKESVKESKGKVFVTAQHTQTQEDLYVRTYYILYFYHLYIHLYLGASQSALFLI